MTLLQQIVSQDLKKVPGIGETLAREILSKCYDGTLESLSRARLYVRGIGEKRQFAINQWIMAVKAQLSTLLNRDFPHKAEIIGRYRAQVEQLERTKKSVEKELSELSMFQREVMNEIYWLRTVSPEHFARAYQGDEKARDLVHRYLMGVFPEWDEPPAWFKRLIKEFG
ncbi:MAG: helix-hairpin-helix domain-containing protein [Deltaproteobacteria bacterium]|nr:helix-hairpin-helix domain-containing protein [Deltaproteobacteria bacterium]